MVPGISFWAGCSAKKAPQSSGDADTDADGDSDSDGDSDGDTDADGDTARDGDAETDSDGEWRVNPDSNTDTAQDTDSLFDSDADKNDGTETESTFVDWPFGDDTGDSDAEGDTGSDTDFEVCETVTTPLHRLPTRAVILLDRSKSMNGDEKWVQALAAINTIVTGYDDRIDFGLDVFPAIDSSTSRPDGRIVLDVAPGNGAAVLSRLDAITAGGAHTPLFLHMKQFAIAYTDYSDSNAPPPSEFDTDSPQCQYVCTHMCNAIGGIEVTGECETSGDQCCDLDAATSDTDEDGNPILYPIATPPGVWPKKYAPTFLNGEGASYLIVISDGNADFGIVPYASWTHPEDDSPIFAELATILNSQKNIQTVVVGLVGAIDEEELNTIAAHGGTLFTEYLMVSDGDELTHALESIAQVVSVSCEYEVGGFDRSEVDYNRVILSFDEAPVPRNLSACSSGAGWVWKDDSRTTIKLCQDACSELRNSDVENVTVHLACSENEIIVVE